MKRVILVWTALVLGFVAMPAMAQQSLPGDQTQSSVPPAPPPPRYIPPPFPPMPKLRSNHHSTHKASKSASRGSTARRHETGKTRHHAAKAHARGSAHRRHHAETRTGKIHLSKRTVRQCHGMAYRQIMKNHYCRSLMAQEIASADHHAAKKVKRHHHASRKAKATAKRHRSHRRR